MTDIPSQSTEFDVAAVVQQTQLEFETLGHIKNALRGAISAAIVGDDLARKLASVRFVTSSLQRYAERLFAWEEHDGYMGELAETHPHLLHRIQRRRNEHDALRESLRQTMIRLELLAPNDVAAFDGLCKELLDWLTKIDRHTSGEIELLEDAYCQDTGGEGGM